MASRNKTLTEDLVGSAVLSVDIHKALASVGVEGGGRCKVNEEE
jgi:hypothetical protein